MGILYIVSTPIGNMADITLRAIETLKTVDFIIAEDTREAGKLVTLLELPKKPYISYRDQVHESVLPRILSELEAGKNLALISDRGTPLISDPGFKLVRDVQSQGYKVESIPGPSAVMAALTVSGLPSDRFAFLGFLPRTKGKQKKILAQYVEVPVTVILFESPFRIIKTLETVQEVYGEEVQVAAVNELTKLHEKIVRSDVASVLAELSKEKLRGEWVIAIRKL